MRPAFVASALACTPPVPHSARQHCQNWTTLPVVPLGLAARAGADTEYALRCYRLPARSSRQVRLEHRNHGLVGLTHFRGDMSAFYIRDVRGIRLTRSDSYAFNKRQSVVRAMLRTDSNLIDATAVNRLHMSVT